MTSTSLRSGLVALTFALLAAPAFAQTPPPADGAPRHGPDMQRMHEMMQKHREEKAQELHAILQIRPDQEAAFSAFEASMTPPPRDQRMKHDRAAMMAMTTPQKLDMMQAKMAEHMQRMQQHIAAIKTFYAALSPQQQQAFDALHRMHGMGMGGHHGRWGGHGGGMMKHGPDGAPPPPPGV
jgi:protein CpxP